MKLYHGSRAPACGCRRPASWSEKDRENTPPSDGCLFSRSFLLHTARSAARLPDQVTA
jgi:hypothetical protein